jgi:ParB/RepB/Spo0J family partition protein
VSNNTPGEARTVTRAQITVEDGFNPRSGLGELDELVGSVSRHGILQPLLVRPGDNGTFVLVDGHRRLAAAVQAKLEQVPVLVREDLNDNALVAALVTALKREDLDPVEEAKAYRRLIEGGLTKKGAAEAVGVPQKTVTVRLQILDVPEKLHPALASGAIALSSVPTLVAMTKASPKLAELVGLTSPGRIDAWAAERHPTPAAGPRRTGRHRLKATRPGGRWRLGPGAAVAAAHCPSRPGGCAEPAVSAVPRRRSTAPHIPATGAGSG